MCRRCLLLLFFFVSIEDNRISSMGRATTIRTALCLKSENNIIESRNCICRNENRNKRARYDQNLTLSFSVSLCLLYIKVLTARNVKAADIFLSVMWLNCAKRSVTKTHRKVNYFVRVFLFARSVGRFVHFLHFLISHFLLSHSLDNIQCIEHSKFYLIRVWVFAVFPVHQSTGHQRNDHQITKSQI